MMIFLFRPGTLQIECKHWRLPRSLILYCIWCKQSRHLHLKNTQHCMLNTHLMLI